MRSSSESGRGRCWRDHALHETPAALLYPCLARRMSREETKRQIEICRREVRARVSSYTRARRCGACPGPAHAASRALAWARTQVRALKGDLKAHRSEKRDHDRAPVPERARGVAPPRVAPWRGSWRRDHTRAALRCPCPTAVREVFDLGSWSRLRGMPVRPTPLAARSH